MGNYIFYFHGGSRNHGCEAIVRSTYNILINEDKNSNVKLYSFQEEEDKKFIDDKQILIYSNGDSIKRFSLKHLYAKIYNILFQSNKIYLMNNFRNLLDNSGNVALSIGGDNYCGYNLEGILYGLNKELNKRKNTTVLWGCSIEPELLNDRMVRDDLNLYSLIITRESITYHALINAGFSKNKVKLFPDPAFTLNTIQLDLPEGFQEGNTIGINISPLVIKCEKNKDVTMKNYMALIHYIIDSTDMQIALIPHVTWGHSNDLELLMKLYDAFKDTGRLVIIEDHNCMELKGYIARCRMFIGARTHAIIGAYSSCVPTLAVGYSVKAKGIAKDLFGTYHDYVIPVQTLEKQDDLIEAFKWLKEREINVREHLEKGMEEYIAKAWQAGKEIRELETI